MNILEKIVAHKRKELEASKKLFPVKELEKSMHFNSPVVSIKKYLSDPDSTGIIAEFKRKSPSKGIIHNNAPVKEITTGYVQAGATALSVLTDQQFFGGSNEDLSTACQSNACPILRKDFVIDEYQVLEARSIGADVILLIAAILSPTEIKKLTDFAHTLGMEVLLEIHTEEELMNNPEGGADLIGINNRDLKTFQVDIETSKRLSGHIPEGVVKVSESGIETPRSVIELRNYGFNGFLIGQIFMQQGNPAQACEEFVRGLGIS